jgi:hexosaminidase
MEINMINVLPKPKICREIQKNELSFCTAIVAKDAAFSKYIPTLSEIFKKIHGVGLAEETGGFILAFDGKISPSSYVIDTSDGFTIRASDKEGLLYGFASAIQLIRFSDGMIFASSVHIEDGPDKEYRALMLDLSRNWYKLNQVLKFVDLCFLYKVNYLHLHFIDNERYTLPSKSFPKIPTKGESYTEEEIIDSWFS